MSQVLAPNPATPAPVAPTAERAALKRCAACATLKPLKDFRQGSKPAAELKTCARCRARYAERRRERKDEERGELRARALDLAQSLLFLADLHPAYREDLHRFAQRIQKSSHRQPDREVEAVTAAILRHACHTVSDITDETGMLRCDVERVLSAMKASGCARLEVVERGGMRRVMWYVVKGVDAGGSVLP